MGPAPKTVATLGLLGAALPVSATVTLLALLRRRPAAPRAAAATARRTVLISGGKMTKALALARAFDRAGHRVVLVETSRYRLTGHRFSRAVDAFHVVPRPEDPAYAEGLLDVVRREGVDVYVPVCSPAASVPDAEAKALLEAHGCEVVHPDADVVRTLDDKDAFSTLAESFGLRVPEHHRITDPAQVLAFDFAARPQTTYVLKSIAYDPVRRLDLTRLPLATPEATRAFLATLPISADDPWVMQEFVTGTEFCTHATARAGAVQLHCCCRSSASQLNYAMEDEPDIEAWVRAFVAALGATGQLSFDFIRSDADGLVRAIECNPRTHSAITLFGADPDVARAYLEDGVGTLVPGPARRPTYWLYNELWRAVRHPARARAVARTIRAGTDAVFTASDPLPFLALHHLQIPSLLVGNLLRGRPWEKIDFNIGKLVEPGGD